MRYRAVVIICAGVWRCAVGFHCCCVEFGCNVWFCRCRSMEVRHKVLSAINYGIVGLNPIHTQLTEIIRLRVERAWIFCCKHNHTIISNNL